MGEWVYENGCGRMGHGRMGVGEWVWGRMGVGEWVWENGCGRMGVGEWVCENGCGRMGHFLIEVTIPALPAVPILPQLLPADLAQKDGGVTARSFPGFLCLCLCQSQSHRLIVHVSGLGLWACALSPRLGGWQEGCVPTPILPHPSSHDPFSHTHSPTPILPHPSSHHTHPPTPILPSHPSSQWVGRRMTGWEDTSGRGVCRSRNPDSMGASSKEAAVEAGTSSTVCVGGWDRWQHGRMGRMGGCLRIVHSRGPCP